MRPHIACFDHDRIVCRHRIDDPGRWQSRFGRLAFSLDSASNAEIAKDATYNAPPGYWLVPSAVTHCLAANLALDECSSTSQVGLITVRARHEGQAEFLLGTAPVYALEPPSGQYGALGFTLPTINTEEMAGLSLRGASDYGTRLTLANLPQDAPISTLNLTLWGVPADVSHDAERFPKGSPGNPPGCPGSEDTSCLENPTVSNLSLSPFTLSPTTCQPKLTATLDVQTYESPEASAHSTASLPKATGCDQLSFNPSLFAEPTTNVAYARSGLRLNIENPQSLSPSVPTPSGLREAFVTLPEGLDISPVLPEGLVVCEDAEAALGSEEPAACPEEALLGTAEVSLAGMPDPLSGKIYLGFTESEEEERLLLIAEGEGVDLKLPIGFSDEPESGQLQLALEQPEIPITGYTLAFFGGRNSIFRTPAFCGDYRTEAEFAPWDEALSPQTAGVSFGITKGPSGDKCLGEAANVGIRLSPASISADGKSQTEATIEIKDAEGTGLPEQEVELTSSDAAERIGEMTDNEDGTYSAKITASSTPGVATITATDLSAASKLSGSAVLTEVATPPPPAPPVRHQPRQLFPRPSKRSKNQRPSFAFSASVPGATFSCKLDNGPYSLLFASEAPKALPRCPLLLSPRQHGRRHRRRRGLALHGPWVRAPPALPPPPLIEDPSARYPRHMKTPAGRSHLVKCGPPMTQPGARSESTYRLLEGGKPAVAANPPIAGAGFEPATFGL